MIRSCLFMYLYVCVFVYVCVSYQFSVPRVGIWETHYVDYSVLGIHQAWDLVELGLYQNYNHHCSREACYGKIVFRASKTCSHPFELSSGFLHTINDLKVLKYHLKSSQRLLSPALRNSVLFHTIPQKHKNHQQQLIFNRL